MTANLIDTVANAICYGDGAATNARRILAAIEAAGFRIVSPEDKPMKVCEPVRGGGKSRFVEAYELYRSGRAK